MGFHYSTSLLQTLSSSQMPALSIEESKEVIKVNPAGDQSWEIQFDKKSGLISSWQVDHSQLHKMQLFYESKMLFLPH